MYFRNLVFIVLFFSPSLVYSQVLDLSLGWKAGAIYSVTDATNVDYPYTETKDTIVKMGGLGGGLGLVFDARYRSKAHDFAGLEFGIFHDWQNASGDKERNENMAILDSFEQVQRTKVVHLPVLLNVGVEFERDVVIALGAGLDFQKQYHSELEYTPANSKLLLEVNNQKYKRVNREIQAVNSTHFLLSLRGEYIVNHFHFIGEFRSAADFSKPREVGVERISDDEITLSYEGHFPLLISLSFGFNYVFYSISN